MKKFEWKWRQKCNHPQCDKRAGYGKRDFSLWSVAALDEEYCLEQLRGKAGNTLYFVRLCETGAHVFSLSLSPPPSLSFSSQHIFFHLFVLFSLVRRSRSSAFRRATKLGLQASLQLERGGEKKIIKIKHLVPRFVLNAHAHVCLLACR